MATNANPPNDDGAATFNVRVVSQLPAPHDTILLSAISTDTSILQLKHIIRNQLPRNPSPDLQRLIYRGRALTRDDETIAHVFAAESAHDQHNLHLVIRDANQPVPPPIALHAAATAPANNPLHQNPNLAHIQLPTPTTTTTILPQPSPGVPHSPLPHSPTQPDSATYLTAVEAASRSNHARLTRALADRPQAVRDFATRVLSTGHVNEQPPAGTPPELFSQLQYNYLVARARSGSPAVNDVTGRGQVPHPATPNNASNTSGTMPNGTTWRIQSQIHIGSTPLPHDNPFMPSPFFQVGHGFQPANGFLAPGRPVQPPASSPLEPMRHFQSELDMLKLRLQRFLSTLSLSSTAQPSPESANIMLEGVVNEFSALINSRNAIQTSVNSIVLRDGAEQQSQTSLGQETVAVLQQFHEQFKQTSTEVQQHIGDLRQRCATLTSAAATPGDDHGNDSSTRAAHSQSITQGETPAHFALHPPDGAEPLLVENPAAVAANDAQNRANAASAIQSTLNALNARVARANHAIALLNDQMANANRAVAAANSAGASFNRQFAPGSRTGTPIGRRQEHSRHRRDQQATQDLARALAQRPAGEQAGAAAQPQPAPDAARDAAAPPLAQALLPILRHLWLLVRIFGFIWFFAGGGSLRRTFYLGLAAGLYLVLQADFLQEFRETVHRHFENLLGPPQQDRPGAAAAQPGGAANAPAGQPGAAPDGAAVTGNGTDGLTPQAVADRLLRERRERDRGWLRERLRGVERVVALFIASLYPGVQVAARERANREAEEQIARLLAETQQAAAPTVAAQQDEADENPGPLFVDAATGEAHEPKESQTATSAAASASNDAGEGSSSAVETSEGQARRRTQGE